MWLTQNLITVLAQSFFSRQAADETDQKKKKASSQDDSLTQSHMRKAAAQAHNVLQRQSRPECVCSLAQIAVQKLLSESILGARVIEVKPMKTSTIQGYFLLLFSFCGMAACCALNWITEGSPCQSAGQEAVYRHNNTTATAQS